MLTTITVSPVDVPVTVTVNNTSHPSHLRHALIIDLKSPNKLGPEKYLPAFLDHLSNIAIQPFDMLQFRGGTPSLAIWEALQVLKNISHLEMISGFDEYCNIELLDQVGSSWPLQSIVIGSAADEDIKTAHIHTITTLTLDYCCSLSFSLATRNGTSKLQHLTIIENDAGDHFIKLQEETSLTKNISELKIVSTSECDFSHQYEPECFGKALIQCHSIKYLDLTLYDSFENSSEEHYLIKLPLYLPPNVEILRFRGPLALANHLTIWHKCVSDPNWLPNLKCIKFCLDVHPDDNEIALEKVNFANDQSTQLPKDLISHRPSVTISNYLEGEGVCF